jgi:neutral ceramidase
MVRNSISLLLGLQMLFFCACSQKLNIPKYAVPEPHAPAQFVAGRARVDITPPPGYPMGGHSISGKVARGYWTRLYARAFYFQDKSGRSLALVSCDLFAIPAGLRSEVARLAAKEGVPLLPDALILAAIHTHHGPGNFMTSELFNGLSSPWPGFDKPLFDFLAGRIAEAVTSAYKDASNSSSDPHSVVLRSGAAPNIQRNRAIDAFFRNPDHDDLIERARKLGMRCPDGTDGNCPRYLATDPTLTVLEVLRKTGGTERRVALLVFFAVHPTAMTHENSLWSSDLVGRAMTSLERDSAASDSLVAGYFNGAEGDVSPRWESQDRDDVIKFGDKLADAVRSVLAHPTAEARADSPEISVRSKAFRIDSGGQDSAGFDARPEFGVASVGGAEDGRTPFYYYGWHGGILSEKPRDGQGRKQPGLDLPGFPLLKALKLTHLLAPRRSFPDYFPLSIARIGDLLTIGAIPVEMTTMMGKRIREKLVSPENPRFVLVGLANEYFSYVTTPEEYDAQDYEGASTIFGPKEGEVISGLLQKLATRPDTTPVHSSSAGPTIPSVTFRLGPKPLIPFGAQFQGERRNSLDEDLEPDMPHSLVRLNSRAPRFEWDEDKNMDWNTKMRSVSIYEKKGGQWKPLLNGDHLEDDDGPNLLTVLVDGIAGRRRWAAIWLPPDGSDKTTAYLFRVKAAGERHCSAAFELGKLPGIEPTPSIPADRVCPAGVNDR